MTDSGHFGSEAFSKEFVCLTRFGSCYRDLLRVLVNELQHAPGHCSTSFTNNLEHYLFLLTQFLQTRLELAKGGISKVCSHTHVSGFALLLTLGSLKFSSVFCLLKGNLQDVLEGDLFWLLWAQDYSTVEQPCTRLLHCCGITSLVLPSNETFSEETKVMLPHSPCDFITEVEQFFSITVTFKSMSFSVLTVVWPSKTVLQLKLYDSLLYNSGFLLWAGHKGISLPLRSFLAGNNLLNSLVKTPDQCPPLPVWCFLFMTLGKSVPLAVWATILYCCILDPSLGQFSLLFSALNLFLHFLSYCMEQSVLSGWVLHCKSVVCVFATILSNLGNTKFSTLCYPDYHNHYKKSSNSQFCKGSCHPGYSCVYNSWVVIIINIFELIK